MQSATMYLHDADQVLDRVVNGKSPIKHVKP
jgi:hypothetical protein